MADNDFPEVDSFTGGPKELRDAYDRLRKAHAKMTGQFDGLLGEVRGVRIAQAGFPEGTKQHAAILKHYQGDLADAEAIKTFAADEFGFEPAGDEPPAEPPADPQADAEARLAAVVGSGSRRSLGGPTSQADKLLVEITKADADGRTADAVSLRNQYAQLTRKG